MKIVISAETTIDLPQELLNKYNIVTVPFGISLGDKFVEDKFGISEEIFDYVEKTKILPKTSAVSPDHYQEYFNALLKDYDEVIHICLSSQISSSYNNACLVANEMSHVHIIDSKSLSTGIALLAIQASELNAMGKSADEIYNIVNNSTDRVEAGFVIEKLNYLHKGGRCSALVLLGANILKIKPEIILSNGKMVLGKKYVGALNKVVGKYCDDLLARHPNPNLKYVFITHSSPMPECEEIITAKLKERGFETIYNTLAGGTISCHCGPGTIGILFMDK